MKIVNVVLFVIMNLLPKITYDHIKLISYSIMNVKLAAQVLSSTVSNVLSNYAPPDAAKNAKSCLLMVVLFDAVNIRDVTSHKFNLKCSLIIFLQLMIRGFVGYEMYFYSISMTGFIPLNIVKVTFLKMQTMKCLFHSKHMRA